MYKQASILSLSKMAEKAFSFLTIIQLTYLFKPEAMGRFFFYFSFISLLIPIMDLGLKKVFVIHWNKTSQVERSELFGSLIIIKMLLGLVCLGLALLVDQAFNGFDASALSVCCCFLAIFSDELGQLFRSADHAKEIYTYEIISPFIAKLTCLAAVFLFKSHIGSIELVLVTYASCNVIAVLLSSVSLRSCMPRFSLQHLKSQSTRLMREGLPFSFTSIFVMLAFFADSVILSFYSLEQTGIYNCAYRIIIVFGVLSGGICHVAFTRFSHYSAKSDLSSINHSLKQIIPFLIVLFGGILFFVMALGQELIDFVYPEDFKTAGTIMLLLAPFILLAALSNIFAHTLEAMSLQKKVMKFNLYSCGANIVANIIFIPIWGMYAAAISTVITEFLNCLMSYLAVRKLGIKFSFSAALYINLSLLALGAFWVSEMNLFIGSGLGVLMLVLIMLSFLKINSKIKTGEKSCVL